MIPFGKILKFRSYDTAMLERMKKDLALSAPLPFWQHCKKYYGGRAGRDPYVEELKLLDLLFSSLQNEPRLIAIHKLYTNDKAVAETYADMMQKRKELTAATSPVTLGELLNLANAYLLRAGKHSSIPVAISEEEDQGLRLIAAAPLPKCENDVFVLLRPDLKQEENTADPNSLLEGLALTSHIKHLQGLFAIGVLPSLLRECNAFRISLDAICTEQTPSFASFLTRSFRKGYLARISPNHLAEVSSAAENQGYSATVIAQADTGGSMTLLYHKKELFSLDTSFLKTMFTQQRVTAKLQNEGDGTLLSEEALPKEQDAIRLHAFCCNQTRVAPRDAFFTNTLYTALLAVIRQCLCGSDYTEQRLCTELRIPKKLNEQVCGNILSIVIALYRLQAELGILSAQPRTVVDRDLSTPSLSVLACGDGAPLPTTVQDRGHRTFTLRVDADACGFPDFEALRALLTRLKDLRRGGTLVSARAEISKDTSSPIQIFLESNEVVEQVDSTDSALLESENPENFSEETKKI